MLLNALHTTEGSQARSNRPCSRGLAISVSRHVDVDVLRGARRKIKLTSALVITRVGFLLNSRESLRHPAGQETRYRFHLRGAVARFLKVHHNRVTLAQQSRHDTRVSSSSASVPSRAEKTLRQKPQVCSESISQVAGVSSIRMAASVREYSSGFVNFTRGIQP